MHPRFGLLGALALSIALRIPAFGSALGNDEAGSALVGSSWLRGEQAVDAAARLYGAHWHDRPPLLPLLYGGADLLAGAAGIRLLGMLFAALLVWMSWLLAREVDPDRPRTAVCSALLVSALASAPALQADKTYGELLAAVPAALAVLLALRACAPQCSSQRLAPLVAAGMAASCAALVKQSALDALVVGAALLVVTRAPWRAWGSAIAGVAAPLVGAAAWASTTPVGIAGLVEALVGFRVDVLQPDAATDAAPLVGVVRLLAPAAWSGLVLVAVLAVVHRRSWSVAGDSSIPARVVLVVWPVASAVGVLAGGFYWPHYLIQLLVPLALLASVHLARAPRAVPALVLLVLVVASAAGPWTRPLIPHTGEFDDDARAVGRAVAHLAAPGDRIEVLYARPAVVHASGLRSDAPHLWSAMQRTRPGTERRIVRTLAARDAPRWVVAWNRPTAFGYDASGDISNLLNSRYCYRSSIRDRSVYERCSAKVAR